MGIIDNSTQGLDAEAPEGAQPPAEEAGPAEAPMEQASPAEAPMEQAGPGEMTPEAIQNAMEVPPEFKDAYTRVVAAGMKVMFDPKTHMLAMKQFQGKSGSVGQRLGESIAGLVFVAAEKAKGALPPQVLIPAGITLLVNAADFLKKSRATPVTDQDVAEGVSVVTDHILKAFKIDPAKVQGFQGAPGLVDRETPSDAPQAPEALTGAPQAPEPMMTGA